MVYLSLYYAFGKYFFLEKKIFYVQFGYIFFYFLISPFLHYYFHIYASDLQIVNLDDSLTLLNILNSIGIIFSIIGIFIAKLIKPKFKENIATIDWVTLFRICLIYFFIASIYYIYLSQTSNLFYIESKTEFKEQSIWKYIILESTPIIFAWLLISHIKIKNKKFFIPYLLIFITISILFAGLRGSRVTILLNITTFIILYIFLVRRISLLSVFLVILFGLSFNSVYSSYKYAGINGLKNYITLGEKPKYIEKQESETLHFILSDLARSDVQAKIIESLDKGSYKPPYFPETYINGALSPVPDSLIPLHFDSKRILGTDALYGFRGNEHYSSSRIYGLLGESLLNFGFYLLPFSFIFLGSLHYLSNSYINSIKKSHLALFLPIFFFIPIYLLFYDFDNIVFQILKNWMIPILIFFIYLFRKLRIE